MYRSDGFPPIAAQSGWAHEANKWANIQISGRIWTDEVTEVTRLCKLIGHDLPQHTGDQGIPEQYYACHTEKQLMAYFIKKHCLLESEPATHASHDGKSVDRLPDQLSNLKLEDALNGSTYKQDDTLSEYRMRNLPRLRDRAPFFGKKTAMIMVSRPVCDDCRRFADCVRRCLENVEIKVDGPSR
ncbi:DYW family of nucleic acid deaminases-domain-containing protein [Xylariaceae sp. FL0255]|nr:DYW family of nucleic acid deaminases-domain-containing protein [Xylariaceae sp. FL0255]